MQLRCLDMGLPSAALELHVKLENVGNRVKKDPDADIDDIGAVATADEVQEVRKVVIL